jgi:hypothetical protein
VESSLLNALRQLVVILGPEETEHDVLFIVSEEAKYAVLVFDSEEAGCQIDSPRS